MEKVVIFGATGSVGAYTAMHLKNAGYDVYAVGRRKSDNDFFSKNGMTYISFDIKNIACFVSLPKNIDYIVHLAGAMPAHMANYDPYEYLNSVIVGTLNVLEYARENHCKKIIFSQSIADILHLFGTQHPILDDVVREFPLKGDHAVYSISKNTAVNLIEHYYAEYGIKRYILRLPTIYHYHPNPYYYVNGEKKWLAYRYIIDQASKGMPLQIWGNPNATKEMVYIKDLTHLIECCILSNVDGGIYNVGCGHPLSIEEQIKQIAVCFAGNTISSIEYKPDMPSSPQFILDIEKAKKELGYNPQYTFDKLLLDFKSEMECEPFSQLWGVKSDYYE